MNRAESQDRKVAALRETLFARRAQGILLHSQAAVSWLTGARTFINMAGESACMQVLVTQDSVHCLANNIEARRLAEEEVEELSAKWVDYPWYDSSLRRRLPAQLAGTSSQPLLSEEELAADLFVLMNTLDDYEQSVMRRLATDTVSALQQVAREFARGESEFALTGRLAKALWERGVEPIVLLVAGDERARLRRHPLPTAQSVEHYGLLVVCGRRQGLVASATRSVAFGKLPDDLQERQAVAGYVDAVAIANSRPGVALDTIFSRIQQAYAERGFPGEWSMHHQGGIGGYGSRTQLAVPDAHVVLRPGMTMAWNPTVTGAKSEDTCLVGREEPEILGVAPGDWPTTAHRADGMTLMRPDVLVR